MTEIKLLTRAGEFVTMIDIPPFNSPAEIVAWGTRHFVRQPDGEYREGLIWYSNEAPRMPTP